MRAKVWLLVGLLMLTGSIVSADEVDDVLASKVKGRDKIHRISGEWTVKTTQPTVGGKLKNPKTLKMKYRLAMEKLPPSAVKHVQQPWKIEAEIIEPLPMRLRVEGEQVWFLDQYGIWNEMPLTPEIQEQFSTMGERFMGADPASQKRHYAIKILRKNRPWLGPSTTTVEFVPKGKSLLVGRREEDINTDGLPLETRIFGELGKPSVTIKVTKHRKVKGIPFVDEMESVSETAAGRVESRTEAANVQVE